eukprot:1155551-Prorocentrum_minimum.AAC.1
MSLRKSPRVLHICHSGPPSARRHARPPGGVPDSSLGSCCSAPTWRATEGGVTHLSPGAPRGLARGRR